MKMLLAMLPPLFFTTCCQLLMKWRINAMLGAQLQTLGPAKRLFAYATDPYIICAYVFSFMSSICWIYVVEKYPISLALTVYMGLLFATVLLASALFLRETISLQHLVGIVTIFVGIAIASRA